MTRTPSLIVTREDQVDPHSLRLYGVLGYHITVLHGEHTFFPGNNIMTGAINLIIFNNLLTHNEVISITLLPRFVPVTEFDNLHWLTNNKLNAQAQ